MRDIALLTGLAAFFGFAFRYPFAATLTWGWLGFMAPNDLVFGIGKTLPLSMIMALQAIGLWAVSKDPKRWPSDLLPRLMILFCAWMTFNSFFAANPDWSWEYWSRTAKTYVFVFMCLFILNSKARIHAMIWIYVISIGFFSAKGGLFTVLKAGAYRVYGPEDTTISDNNQLALAVVMTIPLLAYLWRQTNNKWIRYGIMATFPLQVATVVGSYSRGGVVALAVTLGFFWVKGKNRLRNLVVLAAMFVATLSFMPPEFFDRMNSIQSAGQDTSFLERITSWEVAFFYARDHFPFGAGFYGPQNGEIYHHYFPGVKAFAAHSIYFEILGDQGFPGLALFLLIALVSTNNLRITIRQCKGRPQYKWIFDLATMTQIALIGFYLGGAALSMAYYDAFILLQALTSVLRELSKPQAVEEIEPIPIHSRSPEPA